MVRGRTQRIAGKQAEGSSASGCDLNILDEISFFLFAFANTVLNPLRAAVLGFAWISINNVCKMCNGWLHSGQGKSLSRGHRQYKTRYP